MRKGRGGTGRAGAWLLLLALAGGCGGGEPAPSGSEAGEGLGGPDRALPWTVAWEWALGGVDAPDWSAFGEVTGAAFDGAGNLYVLDGRGGRVTVADREGAFLRTVGAPGEGPGELRFPAALAVHPDGAVTVYDPGHGGFVVFGADGAFLRNVPVDTDVLPAPEGPLWVGGDGGILASIRTPAEAPSRPVVRYDDGPEGVHRILHRGWAPPLPETAEPGPEATGGVRVRLPPVIAFHPALLTAPLPDGGVAVVDSTAWRITLLASDGSVASRLERSVAPTPVGDEAREAERRRRLAASEAEAPRLMVSRPGEGSAAVSPEAVRRLEEARIAGMGFHPVVPVISGLLTDPGGRLWVRRNGIAPGEAGPVDVLGPGGVYLGTLPAGVLPAGAVPGPDGRFAVPGSDDLGAPVIRVLRLGGAS